jgi:N-acyl-D-amino-acid deacylase
MRARAALLALTLLPCATARAADPPVAEAALRDAATRGMALVDRSLAVWQQQRTCFSCHHQALPIAATMLARSRGIGFDEALARKNISAGLLPLKSVDRNVQGYQQIDPSMEVGMELVAGNIAGVPQGIARAATARTVAGWQLPDGHWTTLDLRPPQSYGPITATAIAIRGVRAYWPAGHDAEIAERTARARNWLLNSTPRDTADMSYRLRGLVWTNAADADIARAAAALRALQRADGGWGQLPSRPTDVYATADVMLALHDAGLPVSDGVYQRGLRYLLDHQQSDGSWRVETRMHEQALVSPPHFEIGFPHGEHQMISCMGSTLAVIAVMRALPEAKTPSPPLVDTADWRAPGEAPWMMTALFGSAGELRAALDAGLSPDAATAEGTTLLMMASADIEKVRLLVDRGADVNGAAKTGFTPLMVALNRRGASPVAQLLLDRGARVQPADPKPVHGASPLFYAVWSGNLDAARALVERGASPNVPMKLAGQGAVTMLDIAVFQGDQPMVRQLAAAGLDVNALDEFGLSILDNAVLGNDVGMARTLIALGAKVDVTDETSLTALMHASSVDFGDTAMVELLVASGADRSAKSKDGLTALDLARKFGHDASARVLSSGRASN